MEISNKELRELLNKAWDGGSGWICVRYGFSKLLATKRGMDRRYRDVSKILEEATPQPKPNQWDNLIEEAQP